MRSIFRSWKSSYFHQDILKAPEVYTDKELARIRESGHNGIWAHGLLREISDSDIFPEFNKPANKANLHSLNVLTERAARFGIDVFIYLVEPRCLSKTDSFWKKHPEIKGTAGNSAMIEYREAYAMCTSEPEVLAFLENSTVNLFKNVPKLKGLVLVTASEHLHHCLCFSTPAWPEIYKNQYPNLCPRCRDRNPVQLVSEIINRISRGALSANPKAEIIASTWDWNWYEKVPQRRLISSIDERVSLQVEFDYGSIKDDEEGSQRRNREYSLSFIGPSPDCVAYAKFLARKKRRFYIKLVLGTTHELATVPCIPVPHRVYEKVVRARALKPNGFMGWTFGTVPCINLRVFEKLLAEKSLPEDKNRFLNDLALEYFPGCNPELVCKAWRFFSLAMDLYPSDNALFYYGPVNYSLAYKQHPGPVQGRPMTQTWLDLPRDGDDLSVCCQQYPAEILAERFEEMSRRFQIGVRYYRSGLRNVRTSGKDEGLANAEIIPLIFSSTANIFRTYLLKKDWGPGQARPFREIMRKELRLCTKALPLVRRNRLLGLHLEARTHMFSEELIREKIAHIKSLL